MTLQTPPSASTWRLTLGMAGLLALAVLAVGPEDRLAVSPMRYGLSGPRPAADLLGDTDRERNGLERKRWIEELHRSPEGVNWRTLERRNAEQERIRRNRAVELGLEPSGAWTEVGSRNQAGHTRSVALGGGPDPTLYVGSANGGLWAATLDGLGWDALGDGLFGGVDDVLVHTSPGSERESLIVRRGPELFWSSDAGVTWHRSLGLVGIWDIRSVLALGDEDRTLLVLARRETPKKTALEVLASVDGGRSFKPRWSATEDGDGDMWIPRTGSGMGANVYLAFGGQLHVSVDGARSFEARAVVDERSTAEEICGSEAGAPRLWVAVEVGGVWFLHRSEDEGRSFRALGKLNDFWRSLAADPHDADRLLAGGMECRRSVDGGASFRRVNAWGQYYADPGTQLHADVRGIDILVDSEDPDASLTFVSTDGGTYLSRDRGSTFRNLCLLGLGVSQVYSTLTNSEDPDQILAGTQDQGYQRGRRIDGDGPGPSSDFDQLLSGDYGYITSMGSSHQLVYSSYPGFVLVQEGSENPNLLYPWVDFPVDADHAWMPPVVADPSEPEVFYFLGDRLYRYARRRGPYWGYRPHSEMDFSEGEANYLTTMAFAPATPLRAYAGDDAGRMWTSDDGGVTWEEAEMKGASAFRPTAISVDPVESDLAVVVGSGYGGPGAFRTRDGGRTWTPMNEGLPRTLLLGVAHASDGSGDVYAAGDAGALRWQPDQGAWRSILGVEAPATTYWSVEWVPGREVARFGTYGRGIWDYDPAVDTRAPVKAR